MIKRNSAFLSSRRNLSLLQRSRFLHIPPSDRGQGGADPVPRGAQRRGEPRACAGRGAPSQPFCSRGCRGLWGVRTTGALRIVGGLDLYPEAWLYGRVVEAQGGVRFRRPAATRSSECFRSFPHRCHCSLSPGIGRGCLAAWRCLNAEPEPEDSALGRDARPRERPVCFF